MGSWASPCLRKGLFAGASLVQYLSGKKTDYIGARRIINGTDNAAEIAKDAVILLLACELGAYADEDCYNGVQVEAWPQIK